MKISYRNVRPLEYLNKGIEKYMPKVSLEEINLLWMVDKDMQWFLLKRSDVIELLKRKWLLSDK